jgi:hypothetical protein
MNKNTNRAGTTLTKVQMKQISGGSATYYNTYWKCSPGDKSSFIYVCYWTDPAENFCAGDATTCVYTNKPCLYAECY